MLRFLAYVAIALGLAYCGATVKLGERTFFQHVRRIWATDEAQDLKKGVRDTAAPTVERMKQRVKEGLETEGSGSGSAGSAGSNAGRP